MPLRSLSATLTDIAAAQDPASVTDLNLDGQVKVDTFEGLSRFQSLEQLSLAGCGIRDDVLASFPVLPALTGLILSDNLATNLHALAACTNLRDLDLSGNRISDIKALDPLKPLNLTSLDLGGCPLDVAPADVFDMLATLTYFNGEDRLGKERPADDEGESSEGEYEEEEYQEGEEEEEEQEEGDPAEGGEGGDLGGEAGDDGDDDNDDGAEYEEEPEEGAQEEEEEEEEVPTAALANPDLSDDEEEYVEEEDVEEEDDEEEEEEGPAAKRTRKTYAVAEEDDDDDEEEEEEDDDDSDYDGE